jgi:hypothetical protein
MLVAGPIVQRAEDTHSIGLDGLSSTVQWALLRSYHPCPPGVVVYACFARQEEGELSDAGANPSGQCVTHFHTLGCRFEGM